MSTDATPRGAPPYFAFKTLTSQLEAMEEHGPPPRLDRTYLSHMSGAGQTQFLGGLRYLGLIDSDNKTQPTLHRLVSEKDQRPVIIGELLHAHYPEALELGKTNATTGQLQEVFRESYNANGDTARKAIAFFLNAAEYAGIKVSPNFKTPSSARSNGGARRKLKAQDQTHPPPPPPMSDIPADLHPALVGMLKEIPKQGSGWESEQRREAFKQAFSVTLDFVVPIVNTGDPGGELTGDDDTAS